MSAGFRPARFFLLTGGALALIGVLLWWLLPIRLALPPYLVTIVLALGYGLYCRKKEDLSGKEKPRE